MKLNDRLLLKTVKCYTHMVFAAPPDDVEIMCGDGIINVMMMIPKAWSP